MPPAIEINTICSRGETVTYQVIYGAAVLMANRDRHLDERVSNERFSTEHEALNRARELIDDDEAVVVAVCDTVGNELAGVRLQLKLGYCCV
ncbi:MAG TPA: hypothetical protein VHY35_21415 [Stellaceae bacterium]|nr:hypothetical protein [Stellaceae bacterium]